MSGSGKRPSRTNWTALTCDAWLSGDFLKLLERCQCRAHQLRLAALALDRRHEFAGAAQEFAQLRLDGFGFLQGIDDNLFGSLRVGFAGTDLGVER